jgi:hypothetical protein
MSDILRETGIDNIWASLPKRITGDVSSRVPDALRGGGINIDRFSELMSSRGETWNRVSDPFDPSLTKYEKIRAYTGDPQTIKLLNDMDARDLNILLSHVEDTVSTWLKSVGMNSGKSPGQITREFRQILSSPDIFQRARLVLGDDIAQQLSSRLKEVGEGSIETLMRQELLDLAKSGTFSRKLYLFFRSLLQGVQSTFYTLVLTMAPRFHGANIIGAPSLLYSTTGRILDPSDVLDTMKVFGKSDDTLIFTDTLGRPWRVGDLKRTLGEGVGETVQSLALPRTGLSALKGALDDKSVGSVKRAWSFVNDLAQREDSFFRMSQGIRVLKEGRSPNEARELARRSLYDVGDIRDWEKKIQGLTLFYAFTRNNFVNLLKNLTSPSGWKRISRPIALKRGVGAQAQMTREERENPPPFATTRAILGVESGPKGEPIYMTTASDTTLSALELLGEIITGQFPEILGRMLAPMNKMLIGIEDDREFYTVPPEHVYIINKLSDSMTSSEEDSRDLASQIVSALVGSPVVPRRGGEGEPPWVWDLVTSEQRGSYKLKMQLLSLAGATRLLSDIPKTMGAPGTSTEGSGLTDTFAGQLAFLGALVNPIKGTSAQKRAIRELRDRNSLALEQIRAMAIENIKSMSTGEKSQESLEILEAVTSGKKYKNEALKELTSKEQKLISYQRDIKRIVSAIKKGDISVERGEIEIMKIEKKIEEIE